MGIPKSPAPQRPGRSSIVDNTALTPLTPDPHAPQTAPQTMISLETYPGLYIFQLVFVLSFTGIMIWQAIESIKTID